MNNTNLWSVTAVNGTKNPNLEYVTAVNGKILPPHRIGIPENFCYYPPTEYGSRKSSGTTPPPTENPFGQNSVCPLQMDVGPYAYEGNTL